MEGIPPQNIISTLTERQSPPETFEIVQHEEIFIKTELMRSAQNFNLLMSYGFSASSLPEHVERDWNCTSDGVDWASGSEIFKLA